MYGLKRNMSQKEIHEVQTNKFKNKKKEFLNFKFRKKTDKITCLGGFLDFLKLHKH